MYTHASISDSLSEVRYIQTHPLDPDRCDLDFDSPLGFEVLGAS